ncbi:TPA: autotransporter outer membrane beta-barrel domain-containing protein [Salmonella enterica]|nr:autotransporter outer membrane beta-barrel domain-containing protein [Salmonella enterica subsp. enterica serovar Senftenberg]EAQ6186243.1 autotransporter outer membrane beta-barrel domain-containing protein [Salmonella enterica]HCJ4157504.1 autotransporter outer membrane beta-barrel domain-containing protein [Salmonella enterica]
MNKTYNIIWNAARGMYIVTSELARSGSRAIVSVSASCAVTLLAMDAAPAVAEETRVSIPSQTTTYTLSGATPFVVETGNTVATDTATSAAIVGDNSNDWDLLIESGAVVGSSLTDSQAMNLDSSTGATSVHNQGTITGSNEDGTIMLQNGGSVINDARIENSATYEHDPEDIPQEYAGVYMLNGGSYVSSESGVLEGVSGVIVQSGEAHITNGGMINSDGSWRSYGVEFRDGTYGTIVNTGTIITTASDGSNKIEDAAIYVHTLNDMAVSGSVSVDNSGLMQSDFITVALYHGSHFEVVNRVGGVITAGNSSLVGIKSTAMELKVGVDNLVTNDGTISAYGTANTYGIHYGESTSGGVITNTGSITTTGGGAGDASVYVHGNGDGTIVNNSGTMSSSVYGVYLDSARSKGHTLNNQAGGAISANTAVAINGNGNTITNQGKMTGVSDGLLISGNNNIVTTSGGEISGKNGIRVSKGSGNQITAKSGSKITATSTGISIASGNNQVTTESGSAIVAKDNGILINSGANNVTNGGSITATGSSNSYGIQYNSGASGTITNTGTITTTGKGVGDASVYAHGGAVTINNSGTMDSSVFGVYVTTGHTLNNLAGGSITANTAVQLNGNNNTLANAGAILGDTNGVTISGSGNTLTSQGKITGGTNAVLINSGSKNNTITLNTGTEISGSITDDNNSASANNNLILDGEGTLGSSISGLNSVTSSGDWTLSGATMNLSGTTNSALWVKSGTLILNGAMTAKGATVDSGTTLQIGNGGTLGAFNGDIVDNGTLTFNRSDAAAYGSVISGSGNVVKQGGGELTLSNNNSYSGGTTIAEGTLTATAGGALGSGNIDNRAYLKLDAASASDPFIVADLTTHSGATVEIGAGSTLQANTLTQQDGSTLTADLTETSGPVIRAKNVNLDGTLNVASPASQEPIRSTDDLISLALIESDNAISGDFDDITINGNAMNPDAFITVVGQKNVNDTHYDLVETLTWYADRDNAAIDAHGTFNLADADDSFTVNTVLEDVDANSGWNGQSLTKTGAGTLILNAENTYTGGTTISDGTLVANNVEALGTGNVTDNATLELNTGGDFDNAISGSGQVVKSGDETLTLSGANSYTGGTLISGGTLVATSVEALGSGDVTDNAVLELNTGGTFDNAISGSGQVVKSGDKTLTLSGANSYTGGTTISGGTLVASNVEALGSGDIDNYASLQLNASGQFVTANLTTHDNAITAIGAGSALRANTLTQEANSTLAVHLTDSNSGAIVTADRANLGGTLDITGIGNVAKSWTRDAYAYTLIDSDSAIDSDFAQFTVAGMDAKQVDFLTVDGRVNAADDTRYDVTASLSWYADSDNAATDAHGTFTLSEQGHSFTLNTALTDVDATLNPDSATDWDGKSLIKRGAGTLILGAQNTYSGDTDVQEGTLWLAETATIGSAGSAQAVNIAANAAFGGHNATVNGHVNNQGSLYFVDTFTVNGDVVNSSAMISGSDQPNNTLTIAGNYTGNDGHLYLNTQLGDDSSPTDKLIVTGDTAGSTTLHITNVNGLGAQTVNGIEVIEVGGQSDGDFTLYKGHVDINAWTYTLKQDGGDWYLRSESDDVPDDGGDVTPPDDGGDVTPPDDGGDVTPPDDGGEVTPPDDGGDVTPPDDDGEVTPPDDGGDVTPPDDDGDITPPDGGDVTPVTPQYRADIGVYLGNQWMARNLQMQTLYDREGSQYRSADGSVWMRFKAGKAESQAVNGNVDIDSDYSQFQLGGDILTWSDGAQSVTVGLMGSYINASTDSTGNRGADGSQFSANGSVDGYNLGLYATWFADAQSHRGAYIDSWYQYGAYNNSVDNDGLSASRYDSAAHAVSLETGYRYDIALSNRNTVSLTPQAQVTWQRYSADTVIDDGGTRISGQNDDSWTTRLGVRVDGKLYKDSGRIQPFMEVNWLHASDNASATFGDTKVSQDLPNDRVEVKVGIQANVSERLSVYAQAAGQKGKNDYGDASFSLNMRYNW